MDHLISFIGYGIFIGILSFGIIAGGSLFMLFLKVEEHIKQNKKQKEL